MKKDIENTESIRLDKWLWAARFYKTRSLARTMIEGGKVHYNGVRAKPSKIVELNAKIELWQGYNQIEVIVLGISDVRQKAEIAQKLYQETPESVKKREIKNENAKNNLVFAPHPESKPDKKQRRQLLDFKHTF